MDVIVEKKECSGCHNLFDVFEGDLAFYKRFEVPQPNLCFQCRLVRRLSFYNRRKLYKRKCDSSGQAIVSMFSPDKRVTVYHKDIWYSDTWNALDYARDFDFSRPFFEQFAELLHSIPLPSRATVGESSNSDYTNDMAFLKDCYLSFDCAYSQRTMYSETFAYLADCLDCLNMRQCELCYECVVCQNCYNLKYSRFCKNCSDSWFLRDCVGCKNCFGCANLQQKQFYIFNQPHTRVEYERFLTGFNSGNIDAVLQMQEKVENAFIQLPVKAPRGVQNLDVIGESLSHSKNAFWCFHSLDVIDSRYCTDMLMGCKDCMDVHVWGDKAENCYNSCIIGEGVSNIICSCFIGIGCADIAYSFICTRNCRDLFACVGLQKQQYCILNKQYTKSAYQKLKTKIVAHMRETKEWGEFFPAEISLFGYNESLAFSYYPLSRSEALARGWQWCDFEAPVQSLKTMPSTEIPAHIKDFKNESLDFALECEVTKKPFKITSQELRFYQEHNLPIPRRHPDQRHMDRLMLRNSYGLWDDQCDSCGTQLKSAYAPDSFDKVYCETCYQQEIT